METTTRIERENAVIAKAEANIAAGLGIEFEDAELWLKARDRNDAASPPGSAKHLPTPGGS